MTAAKRPIWFRVIGWIGLACAVLAICFFAWRAQLENQQERELDRAAAGLRRDIRNIENKIVLEERYIEIEGHPSMVTGEPIMDTAHRRDRVKEFERQLNELQNDLREIELYRRFPDD